MSTILSIGLWFLLIAFIAVMCFAVTFVLGVSRAGSGETIWQVFKRFYSEIKGK